MGLTMVKDQECPLPGRVQRQQTRRDDYENRRNHRHASVLRARSWQNQHGGLGLSPRETNVPTTRSPSV